LTRTVHINRDRLWTSLMELKQIGAYDDDATGLRGVRRLALTDADRIGNRRCAASRSGSSPRKKAYGSAPTCSALP
jgi:hypothetical protein